MTATKITDRHLSLKACVYIRQSTPGQVQHNLESQKRQYGLVDRAKQLGWTDVEVIDEDLGCSGSGTVKRTGFEHLLAELCMGKVGAVFSLEASRLARNGRDWHTLLEFCCLKQALIIDADGVYDPIHINDRFLLGMKGTLSEMEVATFRQRAQEAIKQKAARGDLYIALPTGYIKTPLGLAKDPDERVRSAIELVFHKFNALGSARRVHIWFYENKIYLPVRGCPVQWKQAACARIMDILHNPIYAGAYVYGRRHRQTILEDGQKLIKCIAYTKPEEWKVLIKGHHEEYISWKQFEANQMILARNMATSTATATGAARQGEALLGGLLMCGHCGGKMRVGYPRTGGVVYTCRSKAKREEKCQFGFRGYEADLLVVDGLLKQIKPLGLEASVQAVERLNGERDELCHQKELELQKATYDVEYALRQYDKVDPANRLIASTLEKRCNELMQRQLDIKNELETLQQKARPLKEDVKKTILALGEDLYKLWEHPDCPADYKKRILRTVFVNIIVKKQEDGGLHLILHWQGGSHTDLVLSRRPRKPPCFKTPMETVDFIRALALYQPDTSIAGTLNQIGHKTAQGESWSTTRVCAIRHHHDIPVYKDEVRLARGDMKVSESAEILKVSTYAVETLIHKKKLPASQVCPYAPTIIQRADLEAFRIQQKTFESGSDDEAFLPLLEG